MPNKVKSKLTRVPGSTTVILRYILLCPIDKKYITYLSTGSGSPHSIQSWELLTHGDPGSRPWLMSNAFSNNDPNDKSIYDETLKKSTLNEQVTINNNYDSYNNNPFVVYAQPNGASLAPSAGSFDTNTNTNLTNKNGILTNKDPIESEILPEDKFHSKDAGSQYIINQREQAIQDKRDKHAKYGYVQYSNIYEDLCLCIYYVIVCLYVCVYVFILIII